MRLKLSFCFEGAGAVELISEIMTGFILHCSHYIKINVDVHGVLPASLFALHRSSETDSS